MGPRATIARRHAALIANGITVILQRVAASVFDFDLSCSCATAQVPTGAHRAGILQSVRRTQMPICSCLRNEDAPSSPRTTHDRGARLCCITAMALGPGVAGPETALVVAIGALVWIHIVGLRFHAHQRCVCPQVRAWIDGGSQHTHTHTSASINGSSTVSPFARCCPALPSRCRSSRVCIVALGIFRSPLSTQDILVAATRKPDANLEDNYCLPIAQLWDICGR